MKYRGGAARNRTGVNGFADHRVTSPPQHQGAFKEAWHLIPQHGNAGTASSKTSRALMTKLNTTDTRVILVSHTRGERRVNYTKRSPFYQEPKMAAIAAISSSASFSFSAAFSSRSASLKNGNAQRSM